MGKLGVGIIGCGGVSRMHGNSWKTFPDDCKIIAVCDPIEKKARQLMEEFGSPSMYLDYNELLSDKRIDIVSICSPHYLHAPVAIAAANAGKHVITEKPMAMNIGEAYDMIATSKASNTKFTVIFQRRFDPSLRFIKERVVPEIGDIEFSYLIDSHFRTEAYYESAPWRGKWKYEGGGVFANQVIHTWDIFQWYHGGVNVAYGYWTNLLHPKIEVEDIGYGFVEFSCGSHGKLFATSCFKLPAGIGGLHIFGTKGKVSGTQFSLKNKSLEDRLKEEMKVTVEKTKYTGHIAQIRDFIDAIREDREPEVSGETAKESLKILNSIHWHGWNYQEAFHQWAYKNFEMPRPTQGDQPIAEDAENQRWQGGDLIKQLAKIVKSRERKLEAPFI